MPDYLLPAAKDAIRQVMARTGLARTEVVNRALLAYAAAPNMQPRRLVLHTVSERRFVRAYKTLRTVAERHRKAGHDVEFTAVNEGRLVLRCLTCAPERPQGEPEPRLPYPGP